MKARMISRNGGDDNLAEFDGGSRIISGGLRPGHRPCLAINCDSVTGHCIFLFRRKRFCG